MESGLLVYTPLSGKFNIGDYIQSLAAKQYFQIPPTIYIDRDQTNKYNGQPIKLIMNGWYSHQPQNWPPSNKIIPLFVSMHINETVKDYFLTDKSINYFKRYEPIGCRDYNTLEMLSSKGIKAYFSGCLTLTLGLTYKHKKNNNGKIFIVDPFFEFENKPLSLFKDCYILATKFKIISCIANKLKGSVSLPNKGLKALLVSAAFYNQYKKIIDDQVFINAEFICQEFFEKDFKNYDEKFKKAEEILEKYSTAKYVITSRIHCALPCLGMGTPVVFIEKQDDSIFSKCRFGGIINFFNKITMSKDKVISSFIEGKLSCDTIIENKNLHKPYQEELIKRCRKFASN